MAAQIYMVQNNIQRWSGTWFWMQARLRGQAHSHRLLHCSTLPCGD